MSKPKVLVADDDPSLRRLISTTLGSDDFDLLHASTGEEALSLAREHLPTLILLDINMPVRNGFEVCQELKQDPTTAGIKIVMLTARGNDRDRAQGEAVGADDYFAKPFSPVQLLDKVYALVE